MQIAGYTLFGVGIIVAIAGGAKMPADGATYPDTLTVFIIGAVAAAAGLALWHTAVRATRQAAANMTASEGQDAFSLLAGSLEPTRALAAEAENLDSKAITQKVDEVLETYLLPFAQVRRTVLDRLGMSDGAEVLVTIAYGERMLNRVWSAASDGHLPEARACIPEALAALEQAQKEIEASQSAS